MPHDAWVVIDETGGKWGPVDTEQEALNIIAAMDELRALRERTP